MEDRVRLPDEQDTAASPAAPRALLASVYIMAIVLVLLFIALIAGIAWKLSSKKQAVASGPDTAQTLNLGLPTGAVVQSMNVDGDRLVLNAGREVLVIDLRQKAIVLRMTSGGP